MHVDARTVLIRQLTILRKFGSYQRLFVKRSVTLRSLLLVKAYSIIFSRRASLTQCVLFDASSKFMTEETLDLTVL